MIVSVTFMTSLTWNSVGPIFGCAWGCSPIFPRLNPALGARGTFPDHIKNNHELVSVSGDNNLCFFQCLAVHRGCDKRWYERDAQELFNDYCMHFEITYNAFTGVNLSDFVDLKDFSKVNLVAYVLEKGVAKFIQRSRNYTLKQ